jgi:glycosyltransferase involved in cell wall biosynthesis
MSLSSAKYAVNILNHKDLLSCVLRSLPVRILLDYRPALRNRTGVGEFVHELARALGGVLSARGDELGLWTNSWRDRFLPAVASEFPAARIIDRKLPVRALTWSWNHLGWPKVESLAGAWDVVHAQSPLLIPAANAAQVITIHDLDFLTNPHRAHSEMRRDFPLLVHAHARRADAIVVSSAYGSTEVVQRLGVPRGKVAICPPGSPRWATEVAQQRAASGHGSYILFLGTVEERKNVSGLLEAYRLLRARRSDAPRLVIAGRLSGEASQALVIRAEDSAFGGAVHFHGYVATDARPELYRDARMLVLPSFEEGFGLPVLEAMACGVPVVISSRGSLPEVAGAAADPVDPDDTKAISFRMEALLDRDVAQRATTHGFAQAAQFTWQRCAEAMLEAYRAAIVARANRLQ